MLLNDNIDMDAAFVSGNNTCVSKPLSVNNYVSVDS